MDELMKRSCESCCVQCCSAAGPTEELCDKMCGTGGRQTCERSKKQRAELGRGMSQGARAVEGVDLRTAQLETWVQEDLSR